MERKQQVPASCGRLVIELGGTDRCLHFIVLLETENIVSAGM
jgi:hypothetical protein